MMQQIWNHLRQNHHTPKYNIFYSAFSQFETCLKCVCFEFNFHRFRIVSHFIFNMEFLWSKNVTKIMYTCIRLWIFCFIVRFKGLSEDFSRNIRFFFFINFLCTCSTFRCVAQPLWAKGRFVFLCRYLHHIFVGSRYLNLLLNVNWKLYF